MAKGTAKAEVAARDTSEPDAPVGDTLATADTGWVLEEGDTAPTGDTFVGDTMLTGDTGLDAPLETADTGKEEP